MIYPCTMAFYLFFGLVWFQTYIMSRNAAPSSSQLEKLINFLESKPWLAMGHARTANARIRSRQAWSEITTALNSDGGGCTKTSEQWCKYWKDKKGAVKRKISIIAAARRRTGGGLVDLPELSEIELKIQAIMGGESFGTGDQNLEINPFEEQPMDRATESEESPSILLNIDPPNKQQSENLLHQPGHEAQWSNLAAFDGNSVQYNLAQIPSTSASRPVNEPASVTHSPEAEDRIPRTEPTRPVLQPDDVSERGSQSPTQRVPRETLRGRRRILQLSPRQSAARRRLLRRSPPSQRRSEMASITKRFITIEETRAQAELLIAQAISQQMQSNQAMTQAIAQAVAQVMADALDRFTSVIRDFINHQ